MSAVTKRCTRCGGEFPDEALFCPLCGEAQARSADDPLLGKVLADRYLLQARIGQGSSGTVYRAEHTTLRRKAAVKILHHQLCSDDNAIERFRREATTVAAIDNQHILEVLDFGRAEDGRLYFAMELLEGETLAEVIAREQRLAYERIVDVLVQVGEALIEAHGMGYVHRDLRPRNIFLSRKHGRDDFVKLLDFGLAKLIRPDAEAAQTQLGMTFGDPRYMSPEQARGDPVDRRADIYSLGVIGYEMVTGEPPFAGGPTFQLLTRHIEETPRRPRVLRPDVPPTLESVILTALAKQRDDRFVTVARMLEALRDGAAELLARVPGSGRVATWSGGPATRSKELPAVSPTAVKPPAADRGAPALPAAPTIPEELRHAPAGATLTYIPQASRDTSPRVIEIGPAPAAAPAPAPPAPAAVAPAPPPASAPGSLHPPAPMASPGYGPPGAVEPPAAAEPVAQHEASIPTALIGQEPRPASASSAWFAAGEANDLAVAEGQSLTSSIPSATQPRPWWHLGLWGVVGLAAAALALVAIYLWMGRGSQAPEAPVAVATGPTATSPTAKGATGPTAAVAPSGPAALAAATGPSGLQPTAPAATGTLAPTGARAATGAGGATGATAPTGPPTATKAPTEPREPKAPKEPKEPKEPKAPREPKPPREPPEPKLAPEPPAAPASADQERITQHLKAGRDALRRGAHAKAAAEFAAVRELDPRNADAIAGLGDVAFEQGQYQEATVHLKAALRLQPRRAGFHVSLGNAYYKLGRVKDAVAEYKTALKLNPNLEEARHALGVAEDRLRGGPP
jgi:serine/threonine-protein kinase